MITRLTRRLFLGILTTAGTMLGCRPGREVKGRVGRWHRTHDRVWLGEEFWANPMEDWRVVDGAAECGSGGPNRNIRLITHQVKHLNEPLEMSVRIDRVEEGGQDGGAGFRVGMRSDIDEYRSNSFAKGGVDAGVVDGSLILGDETSPLTGISDPANFVLELSGRPDPDGYRLTLRAGSGESGEAVATLSRTFPPHKLLGQVALVNGFHPEKQSENLSRYRFSDWTVSGKAFQVTPEQTFGPVLWSMYSLSDSRSPEGYVLKMNALTGPLGPRDNHEIELQIERDGAWNSLGEAQLDRDAWTATFRIPNWDSQTETPYRLIYRERYLDGEEAPFEWAGTIKAEPSGRPLRLGALTCQNDYAFPYEPVLDNLLKLDPDMLYFSGDQLYENHGGYGFIRAPAGPAILNYLRKFYQFGWAFREAMRDRPTLCIPDDHDVFQGNIWGEGGARMDRLDQGASSKGGYAQPARMVNVVHKTSSGHHPDPFDPTPAEQDISVYYGDMVYGGVGFAILGDRQWKSGPERVDTGEGRADHVLDPDFDTSVLDREGLALLGERQETFLSQWAQDWRGHTLKVLLSQTVLAGVATHHGSYDGYLKADLDSGAWPQTARNRAVAILRKSMALHVNGDQHLASLTQYGVERQRDSNWSFCTPAIAAGYPRWWRPDELGMRHRRRPQHGLPHTGEFIDSMGNRVYVYAVGNPEVGTEANRYDLAHQKGSGFGLVTIDPEARTYHLEAFRFLVDATDGKAGNQFPGWPLTLHQSENQGENIVT